MVMALLDQSNIAFVEGLLNAPPVVALHLDTIRVGPEFVLKIFVLQLPRDL